MALLRGLQTAHRKVIENCLNILVLSEWQLQPAHRKVIETELVDHFVGGDKLQSAHRKVIKTPIFSAARLIALCCSLLTVR